MTDGRELRAVALIPARGGSTRLPGKNVRPLMGHPLIAYTIAAAVGSGMFDSVVVSTDSREIARVATDYGAEVLSLRPAAMALPTSPDIDWVLYTLRELDHAGRATELWSLLRPTSPLRSAESIRGAFEKLIAYRGEADSIRAVQSVRQHPGKMWVLDGDYIVPLLPQPQTGVPMHSRQYHDLPEVYVQDSSLEISWVEVALGGGGIAGTRVLPWWPPGHEGLSVDYLEDWEQLERLIASGTAVLPSPEKGRLSA